MPVRHLVGIERTRIEDEVLPEQNVTQRSGSDAIILGDGSAVTEPDAFYISPTGNDTDGDGSLGNPWQSLDKAQSEMVASATINKTFLRGGTYLRVINLVLDADDSGQTWEGFPSEVAILDGNGRVDDNIFFIDGAINCTFKDLVFQNMSGILSRKAAISCGASNGLTVEGCTFQNLNRGIQNHFTGNTGWKILGNKFIDLDSEAIKSESADLSNSFFAGNYILRTGRAVTLSSPRAITLDRPANNVTIEYNTIDDPGSLGIFISSTSWGGVHEDVTVQYNVVLNWANATGVAFESDTGGIYVTQPDIATEGDYINFNVQYNWVQDGGLNQDGGGLKSIGLIDGASGVTCFGNVFVRSKDYSVQIHGGRNITLANNIALLVEEGRDSNPSSPHRDERFLFHQIAPITLDPDLMVGTVVEKNILLSVDRALTPVSYTSVTPENDWVNFSGGITQPIVARDQVRWENIANLQAIPRTTLIEEDFSPGWETRINWYFRATPADQDGRQVSIAQASLNGTNNAITITWPQGARPSCRFQAWWRMAGGPYDEVWVTFDIRFENNWVPGWRTDVGTQKIAGMQPLDNSIQAGVPQPCPNNDWSFRMSSRTNSGSPYPAVNLQHYMYFPDRTANSGQEFDFSQHLQRNTNYTVEMHFKKNSADNVSDGVAEITVNESDLGTQPTFKWYCGGLPFKGADMWQFASFYGGGDDGNWFPSQDSSYTLGNWKIEVPASISEGDGAGSTETSSVAADPDFHTYDPANNVLRLNKLSRGDLTESPAYAQGFVDIAGVTDGGTFTLGSPFANPNSGYDRDNY